MLLFFITIYTYVIINNKANLLQKYQYNKAIFVMTKQKTSKGCNSDIKVPKLCLVIQELNTALRNVVYYSCIYFCCSLHL